MRRRIVERLLAGVLALIMIIGSTCADYGTCANAETIKPYIIRVGLTNNLKQKNSIKISTTKIAIGYSVENVFSEYIHFTNKNGFTLSPAKGYFLVSDTIYSTYSKAMDVYKKAMKVSAIKGYTYLAMVGKNKWAIYIGGLSDVAKVSGLRTKAEDKLDTSFSAVTSYQGHRVKISGGTINLLYDGQDTGQYVQISPNILNSKGSKTITVNGYEYRGRIEVGPYGGDKLTVVNVINVENYLRGAVGSVMNSTYSMNAQCAMAIVERTYAESRCDDNGDTNISNPYSLNDSEDSIYYAGYKKESTRSVEAVTSTRGKTIYLSGEQISAEYTLSSGGYTDSSKNLWGLSKTYLKGVSDVNDLTYGKGAWKVSYTADELGEQLNVGKVTDVSSKTDSTSIRLKSVTVTGANGSVTLMGDNLRNQLGLPSNKCSLVTTASSEAEVTVLSSEGKTTVSSLKSCYAISAIGGKTKKTSLNNGLFSYIVLGAKNARNVVSKALTSEDTYVFIGTGKGSGLGFSVAGAKSLAKRGYTYQSILKYYYGNKIKIQTS